MTIAAVYCLDTAEFALCRSASPLISRGDLVWIDSNEIARVVLETTIPYEKADDFFALFDGYEPSNIVYKMYPVKGEKE